MRESLRTIWSSISSPLTLSPFAMHRVQADLAYGVLIGEESVGCIATTSTLFWSDLRRKGPNRAKVATTAASTRPVVTASPVSFRLVSLVVGPLGMSNSMPPSEIESNRDAWEFKALARPPSPPPWTVEKIPGGFQIVDAMARSMASVYPRRSAMLTSPRRCPSMKLAHGDQHRQVANSTREGLVEKHIYGGAAIQCALSVGSDSASLPR